MGYLVEDIIASVKRRARIPTAQSAFATADYLAILNEEMLSYIVPLVSSVREEYWNTTYDQPLVDGTISYRIPPRAIGGGLREVQLLDVNGYEINLTRLDRADAFVPQNGGCRLDGAILSLVSNTLTVTDLGVTLRMIYQARPNTLVATTAARTVASFTPATKQVVLSSAPPASFTSAVLYDIVRAQPIFDSLAIDQAATVGGSTLTFATSLPADLAVGDYVCLAGESPIPQIPVEIHPLLAQRGAVKCLEALGDDGLTAASQVLGAMEVAALKTLSPRLTGEAVRLVNRNSLYRTRF